MELKQGYLASPTNLYGTWLYSHVRRQAYFCWPEMQWIEPALQNWPFAEWRARWAAILTRLDLLAVLPRPDLSVGRGCWFEITDCQHLNIPIAVWLNDHWSFSFSLKSLSGNAFSHWARIVPS